MRAPAASRPGAGWPGTRLAFAVSSAPASGVSVESATAPRRKAPNVRGAAARQIVLRPEDEVRVFTDPVLVCLPAGCPGRCLRSAARGRLRGTACLCGCGHAASGMAQGETNGAQSEGLAGAGGWPSDQPESVAEPGRPGACHKGPVLRRPATRRPGVLSPGGFTGSQAGRLWNLGVDVTVRIRQISDEPSPGFLSAGRVCPTFRVSDEGRWQCAARVAKGRGGRSWMSIVSIR